MESIGIGTKRIVARMIRASVLTSRRLLGRSGPLVATRGGITWELDLDEVIDLTIFALGCWERSSLRTYRQLIRAGDTVIDVGANVGAHTLPIASMIGPHGTVLACEPTKWGYGKLLRNVSLNPRLASSIVARQVMLTESGACSTPEALYASWPVDRAPDLHSAHAGRLLSTHGAAISTLDDQVAQHSLKRVDFIKVDVDGAEPQVLMGARETIAQHRPVVLLEWTPCLFETRHREVEAMFGYFSDCGYVGSCPPSREGFDLHLGDLWGMAPKGSSVNLILTLKGDRRSAQGGVDDAGRV